MLARYGYLLDRRETAAWLDLFTSDAVLTIDGRPDALATEDARRQLADSCPTASTSGTSPRSRSRATSHLRARPSSTGTSTPRPRWAAGTTTSSAEARTAGGSHGEPSTSSSRLGREPGEGCPSVDHLAHAATNWPDRPGLIERQRSWTWVQLDAGATSVAVTLRGLGIEPGDPVLLLAANDAVSAAAFHGAIRIGATVVLLPITAGRGEYDDVVRRVAPRVVIGPGASAARARGSGSPVARHDRGDRAD